MCALATSLPISSRHHESREGKVLYLIGYGINWTSDRTRLADYYIADSEVLFAMESDIDHILAATHPKPVINLIDLYQQGIPRPVAYDQIADRVLNAFSDCSRVGLLVEGSPFFLDSICELLEERSRHRAIDVIYVDGRSSLDVIIQTLRIPLRYGLGVYLAETYCADGGGLNAEAINFFFQPGNVGSERIQMHSVDRAGVHTLKEALLQFYEPTQRWFLIGLGQSAVVPTRIIWNRLSELEAFYSYMHSGTLVLSKNWWPIELLDLPPTNIMK